MKIVIMMLKDQPNIVVMRDFKDADIGGVAQVITELEITKQKLIELYNELIGESGGNYG